MKPALAATAVLLVSSLVSHAQQIAPANHLARVTFDLDRPGLEVPKFTLSLSEDGEATYLAEEILANARPSNAESVSAMQHPEVQHIDRQIVLSPATTKRIFAAARELNRFSGPCASRAKNIADTGKKTLHYMGDDGAGTCVYNYSEDKKVVMLTDTFEAIAATLDIGRKLDFDHRFDRLGLDALTAQLVQEAEAGRAIELTTISPTLRSIVADSDVLERVRSRASKLLQQAQPAS